MRILYFGNYNPNYARNRILIDGLRENGVEVLECNVQGGGFRALPKLFLKYLKLKTSYDVMIVGFPGQEVMFLARFLTLRFFSGQARKPIIFDAFASHYGGYIIDRKKYPKTSLMAKYYRFLDKWSCRLADLVLLDTQAHINFFVEEFNLPPEKFRRIWIGADDKVFKPLPFPVEKNVFRVLFFGTFIPLQGIKYILQAVKILEDQNIFFTIIGDGQEKESILELNHQLNLKNIEFKGKMLSEGILTEAKKCHLCLGIFGDTPKTALVIPNKIYESLAMRRPVISGDTSACRELFSDDNLMMVQPADSESLAKAILELKNNLDLRGKLVENGYNKFIKYCTPKVLGGELKLLISNLTQINEKK
ncbi:MAG: glycosyltransferase [Patescibacteria group bacterium]